MIVSYEVSLQLKCVVCPAYNINETSDSDCHDIIGNHYHNLVTIVIMMLCCVSIGRWAACAILNHLVAQIWRPKRIADSW